MSPAARLHPSLRLLKSKARKIHKNLYSVIQQKRKAYHATLGPAKRWIVIVQKRAKTRYLFGWARCDVQSNNVVINHLFTHMFGINRYIHTSDRLNLTDAPIGPIRVDHKITKAEIKQCGYPMVFFTKNAQKLYRFPVFILGWLASLFDEKNLSRAFCN